MTPELLDAYRWNRQLERAHKVTRERYFRWPTRAAYALELARADVVAGRKRYPLPTSGRGVTQGWNPQGDDGARWVENLKAAGLRFVAYADEIVRSIQHRGWYTEDNGDNGETLRGCVLQLPARAGRPQFVAAYEDPNNPNTYRVDLSRSAVYAGDVGGEYVRDQSAAHEAAHAADSFAQRTAESERDYNRAWRAGSRWADLGEEIKDTRSTVLQLLAERRKVRHVEAPTICATLIKSIRDHLASIEKARAKRAELADSVWRDHFAAFNEGAGESVLS